MERQKKKLLFIVEAMGGGVFTYIVDLANALLDTFDIYIAYAVRPQTPVDYQAYFDKRIHLICVKNFTRSVNPIKDMRAFLEIRKIADKIRPDIIHLHSSKAGAIGRFAFNGKRIPLFYTPHGYSFLMQNCGKLKRMIYLAAEYMASKRKCTTISCSKGEHQETLKLTKRAMYVNNGINTAQLDRLMAELDVRPHPFTVFTLGRICYQKNPELFNRIALEMPDVQFLWIGDGEMREYLTAPNIEITGWVDRSEALGRSVNADVFLLTSLWEGLPISLLEAMHMKKLAVVNDVIGNHDVIHNGLNGYVCQTVTGFVEAIRSARESDRLVEAAHEEIKNEYNTKVMAAKYKEIYEKAILLSRGE